MGRSPCCDKVGLKKGPWTPEEDQKLLAYIEEHGHGSWRALPAKAGLQRCGKSCRLRWTNYLRPDIKRGKFSLQEEQTIIQLHALLGNRWSAIATHLPKRTDNEIKNYWNTHLKKRLTKMGIDPVTHKPKNDALLSTDGQSNKTAANLSHMAQWESARLEAEARLVRESKLRSHSLNHLSTSSSSASNSAPAPPLAAAALPPPIPSHSLDVLKAWNNGGWLKSSSEGNNNGSGGGGGGGGGGGDLESPTSTLSFSENIAPQIMGQNGGVVVVPGVIEFVGSSGCCDENGGGVVKEEGGGGGEQDQWKGYDESSMAFTSGVLHELTMSMEGTTTWGSHESLRTNSTVAAQHDADGDVNNNDNDNDNNNNHSNSNNIAEEGFTNLLLNAHSDDLSEEGGGESNNGGDHGTSCGSGSGSGSDFYEDNKNYWNSILNLVNSSPSDSPMF